jgi:hypothetical protein
MHSEQSIAHLGSQLPTSITVNYLRRESKCAVLLISETVTLASRTATFKSAVQGMLPTTTMHEIWFIRCRVESPDHLDLTTCPVTSRTLEKDSDLYYGRIWHIRISSRTGSALTANYSNSPKYLSKSGFTTSHRAKARDEVYTTVTRIPIRFSRRLGTW